MQVFSPFCLYGSECDTPGGSEFCRVAGYHAYIRLVSGKLHGQAVIEYVHEFRLRL
jgi:hypothetical protein